MKNILYKTLGFLAVFIIFAGIAGVAATFIFFWAEVINLGASDEVSLFGIIEILVWTMIYGITSYSMIIFGTYMGQQIGKKID